MSFVVFRSIAIIAAANSIMLARMGLNVHSLFTALHCPFMVRPFRSIGPVVWIGRFRLVTLTGLLGLARLCWCWLLRRMGGTPDASRGGVGTFCLIGLLKLPGWTRGV